MNKTQLRLKYKALRKKLTQEQINDLSIQIANNVLPLPIWNFSNYHIFLSIQKLQEVSTESILHILSGKDKHIIVSKSNFSNKTLRHFLLTDQTIIKPNSYGIPEPTNGIEIPSKQIDVVFIPLLAFDIKGNRVGYGKGFYDAFLATCQPTVIKIGLSFFEAETAINEILKTDVPLNYCVTPKQTYCF